MSESSSRSTPGPRTFTVRPAAWPADRAALLAVRTAVFVAEQGVPPDIEADAADATAEHFLACDTAGAPIGTARLLADAHIGRIAVLRDWRGRGVGRALLEAAVARARERAMSAVVLHAQSHAAGFYAGAGFVTHGEPFMEAGIRHVRMVRTLARPVAPP